MNWIQLTVAISETERRQFAVQTDMIMNMMEGSQEFKCTLVTLKSMATFIVIQSIEEILQLIRESEMGFGNGIQD